MQQVPSAVRGRPLYTPLERARRDRSVWTLVQGILAPLQLFAFLISVWLVVAYLQTGEGEQAATLSIVVKTLFLYAIMITGAIWEKEVFGVWLFAPSFFWEDVVSMFVIALHTAYLYAMLSGALPVREQMLLALVAYAAYVVNALQFFYKLYLAKRAAASYVDTASSVPTARDAAWSRTT
jgi:3-vinyl bacteriochlorophyllide hydratase